jgi:hypothetical protein
MLSHRCMWSCGIILDNEFTPIYCSPFLDFIFLTGLPLVANKHYYYYRRQGQHIAYRLYRYYAWYQPAIANSHHSEGVY